jgi:hypothetical protein
MTKAEALARLGWDPKLLESFADSLREDIDAPAYDADFTDSETALVDITVNVEHPVLVTGIVGSSQH